MVPSPPMCLPHVTPLAHQAFPAAVERMRRACPESPRPHAQSCRVIGVAVVAPHVVIPVVGRRPAGRSEAETVSPAQLPAKSLE